MRFTLPDEIRYSAGDVLNIKPRNPPHLVRLAIDALPWDVNLTGTCLPSLLLIHIYLLCCTSKRDP